MPDEETYARALERRYAQSGAPQYLLVDPRDGVCVLYTGPMKSEGTYQDVETTKFGQPITGVHCMAGRT